MTELVTTDGRVGRSRFRDWDADLDWLIEDEGQLGTTRQPDLIAGGRQHNGGAAAAANGGTNRGALLPADDSADDRPAGRRNPVLAASSPFVAGATSSVRATIEGRSARPATEMDMNWSARFARPDHVHCGTTLQVTIKAGRTTSR